MAVTHRLAQRSDRKLLSPARGLVLAGVALALVTFVLATAGRTWSWTGFAGEETVWGWLELLLQPVAVVALVVQLISPPNPRRWVAMLALAGGALGVLMFGGYVLGWGWTGFDEYRLWDWLHLMVLPLIFAFLPVWLRAGAGIGPRMRVGLALVCALFVVAAVGGYGLGWGWTGCTDKTFRDWLNLLIAPFLAPLACKWFLMSHPRYAASLNAATSPSGVS